MSSVSRASVADQNDGVGTLTQALERSWPILITVTPANLGLDEGEDSLVRFLVAVRHMADEGLMTYEALIVGSNGTRLVDAALTARGRAALRPGNGDTSIGRGFAQP